MVELFADVHSISRGGRVKNPQYYMLPMYNYKAKGGRPNFGGWNVMCPEMNIGFVLTVLR